MIEETRLNDDYPDIEGVNAASHMGVLHLHQDEVGEVALQPRTQWDLLEFLYARRYELYRATHLTLGIDDMPAWVKSARPTRVIEAEKGEQS